MMRYRMRYRMRYHIRYLCLVPLLHGSVLLQQLLPSIIDCSSHLFCVSKGIEHVCSIQLIFGTFAHRTIAGAAHQGGCNLLAIHAAKMIKGLTQANLPVSKANIKGLSDQSIDFLNDRLQARMVKAQAPSSLRRRICNVHQLVFQDRKTSQGSPGIRFGHDMNIVVLASHCSQGQRSKVYLVYSCRLTSASSCSGKSEQ